MVVGFIRRLQMLNHVCAVATRWADLEDPQRVCIEGDMDETQGKGVRAREDGWAVVVGVSEEINRR